MDGILLRALSALLVLAGLCAEANLLRIFLQDWMQSRRDRRQWERSLTKEPTMKYSETSSGSPRVHGALPLAVVVAGAAFVHDACGQAAGDQAVSSQAVRDQAASGVTGALPGEGAVGGGLSVQLNFDYATAYYYHGIVQEDTGLILQPAAKITASIMDGDSGKLDAFFGTWNSFHGQKTAAATQGDFTEYWYESDVYAGLSYSRGCWSATANYIVLTSPSDAYETVQELDLTMAFDDTAAMGAWALHPYAMLGIETGADGSDGGGTRPGMYLELGVAPGFTADVHGTPVAFSFPVTVGLSLSNYYEDASGDDGTFGFAQVGAKASVPLPFGTRYGQWTLNAGVAAMFLGDHTAAYNADDDTAVVGMIGLQANF